MKQCPTCEKQMKQLKGKTPEGVAYSYFQCPNCKKEILDMKQLHEVAQKYRTMKKYNAKVSKWGMSLGIRIPKELASQYKLKDNENVMLIPEKEGIKIILP